MDGIGVSDVVDGCFPSVELSWGFLVNGVAAAAVLVFVVRFGSLRSSVAMARWMVVLCAMIVLGIRVCAQPSENQCNTEFVKTSHIVISKRIFKIGCKSTMSFLDKKNNRHYFFQKK